MAFRPIGRECQGKPWPPKLLAEIEQWDSPSFIGWASPTFGGNRAKTILEGRPPYLLNLTYGPGIVCNVCDLFEGNDSISLQITFITNPMFLWLFATAAAEKLVKNVLLKITCMT